MFNLGGAEIQTWYYAMAFSKLNWKTFFISPETEKISSEFDDANIRLLLYKKTKNSLKETLLVINLLVRIKPEYVFYRYIRYQYGLIVLFCKFFLGTKFIYSTMSDPLSGAKAATLIRRRRYSKNASGIFPWLQLKFFIEDQVFYFGVRYSNHHMVQNTYQLDLVQKEFSRKGFIIHNNTMLAEYSVKRENIVLFIATLKEFKHPEIFCKLSNACQKKDYRFILIGQNFSDAGKAIEFLDTLEESNVEYKGQQPFSEVHKYLEMSKLLINTSSHEGFPNTFVQAWARGVPVISLSVDPDNLIQNHSLGYVCNNEFNLLLKHTVQLMDDNETWNIMSKAAFKYAQENLDTMNVTTRIMKKL